MGVAWLDGSERGWFMSAMLVFPGIAFIGSEQTHATQPMIPNPRRHSNTEFVDWPNGPYRVEGPMVRRRVATAKTDPCSQPFAMRRWRLAVLHSALWPLMVKNGPISCRPRGGFAAGLCRRPPSLLQFPSWRKPVWPRRIPGRFREWQVGRRQSARSLCIARAARLADLFSRSGGR